MRGNRILAKQHHHRLGAGQRGFIKTSQPLRWWRFVPGGGQLFGRKYSAGLFAVSATLDATIGAFAGIGFLENSLCESRTSISGGTGPRSLS